MSFLSEIEELKLIESFSLTVDGIEIEITKYKKDILVDFVRYQSIDETGMCYAKTLKEKIDLINWFLIRGCNVNIKLSKNNKLGFIDNIKAKFYVYKLNNLLNKARLV